MRQQLVVVIPGIGGSVLVDAAGREVWSTRVASLADLLRAPEQLSVDVNAELTPRGLVMSLKPVPFWTAIPGYECLLRRLGELDGAVLDDGTGDRVPGANVVAFGYDFRLGVEHAAARLDSFVRDRLRELWPAGPGRGDDLHRNRVLIVAHSMGGLVARNWAGQPGNQELCRAMMTLGTPHRGAPKALDVLVNGLPLARGLAHLAPRDMMAVLRGWQSVYDLLPRFPLIADTSTGRPRAGQETGPLLRPHELPTVSLPAGWDTAKAASSHEMHQRIQGWWDAMPRRGPVVVPRIGYGHGTQRRATWNGRRLKVGRGPFHGLSLAEWDDDRGDGTVPAVSGLPVEMSNQVPVGLRQKLRHGPIGTLDSAVGWVQDFEGRPRDMLVEAGESPDANPRPVVLGMDVEPVAIAGEPVPVAARVLGVAESPASSAVWLLWRPYGQGGPQQAVRLEWDADAEAFRGEAAGAAPGVCTVTVTCDAVPGGGAQATSETVEVVEP